MDNLHGVSNIVAILFLKVTVQGQLKVDLDAFEDD
jgi:hypothetical protein